MRRVLMIAFHYPPLRGSSGIQRTLKFTRYLHEYGWAPIVLTAHPRAYPLVGDDLAGEIRETVVVKRAFALDTARHLAIRGRYLRWLAMPDRWVSWWIGALRDGLEIVRNHRPQVLWSTYPIATAHLIGATLHRLTGIPWIADFRDSMTEPDYPRDRPTRAVCRWLERVTVEDCERAVFTAPGAIRMYAKRYPSIPESHWSLIRNGFDEENFALAERQTAHGTRAERPLVMVHSGLLYRSERDPRSFFAALGDLRRAGRIDPNRLRIVLRASGDEEYHRHHIQQHGIEDIVSLEPGIPYQEALQEMLGADALLLFQASNCNHQIPAKVYEYLRARRPVLALTDPEGDTAGVLREAGVGSIAPLDSAPAIAAALERFLRGLQLGDLPVASDEELARHSRRWQTRQLSELLDSVAGSDRP